MIVGDASKLKALLKEREKAAIKGIREKHESRLKDAKKDIEDIYRRKIEGVKNMYKVKEQAAKQHLMETYLHKRMYEEYETFLNEIKISIEKWVKDKTGDANYAKTNLKRAYELLGDIEEVICSEDFFGEAFASSSLSVTRVYGEGVLIFKRGKKIFDASPKHLAEVFEDEITREVMDVVKWDI